MRKSMLSRIAVLHFITISYAVAWSIRHPFKGVRFDHLDGHRWAWFRYDGKQEDVCYNPQQGRFEFSYCATARDDPRGGFAKTPHASNHYAVAAWASCVNRWNFRYVAGAPCPANTRLYTWSGDDCLHNEAFWNLPEHTGDPWLQKLPKIPHWDGHSSGISLAKSKKMQAIEGSTNDHSKNNKKKSTEYPPVPTHPKDSADSNVPEVNRLMERTIPSIAANLTTSLVRLPSEGGNGPYKFEYCSKNDLEAHLIVYEARMVSNTAAFQAWVECKSSWPVVHTLEDSVPRLCRNGGRSIVFFGSDCYNTDTYYNSEPYADDPFLSHKHHLGCGSGIHASITH